ncbi:hypothetical protein AHiyo8_18880 [Arthrobacter sp. Hiyo8]|nr:hypothetical protein AHiyo8_18880 [Arthrobacter sp. Hiyo8]
MITQLSARYVLGYDGTGHVMHTDGHVVMRDDEIIYVVPTTPVPLTNAGTLDRASSPLASSISTP